MEVLNKNLNKADAWLDTWDGCRSTDRDMGREPKPEISPLPLAPPPHRQADESPTVAFLLF